MMELVELVDYLGSSLIALRERIKGLREISDNQLGTHEGLKRVRFELAAAEAMYLGVVEKIEVARKELNERIDNLI